MLIRDIMIDQPITVAPELPISDVVRIMIDKRIGFMVVEEDGKACGVLTEGDLVGLAAQGIDIRATPVRQFKHSPVFGVQADANVFYAYDKLVQQKMRHLVVENEVGEIVGVVTMSSFIANLGVEHFSELQRVSDILHHVEVTVATDTLVIEAIQRMHECKHAMIVIDQGKAVGILTSRAVVRLCGRPFNEWKSLTVQDVMKPPVCIYRKAFVPEASALMKEHRTRHLIVVGDREEFIDLVTISDVAHSMEGRYVEFMRSVMQDMGQDLLTAGSRNRALFERNPNAVFSLDSKGIITHVNPAAILLTGFGSEYLENKAITEFYDQECLDHGIAAFESAKNGDAKSMYLRMLVTDARTIHIFMSFVPVQVEGIITGVYAVSFDMTERVMAELRLYRLSEALQQAGEPIAITDAYGVIEFANLKMHQLFAYEEGCLIGTNLETLEHRIDGRSQYKENVWASVKDGVPYKGEFFHQSKTGKMLDLRLSCAPVHVPGAGRVDYFVNIYEDMSFRREMEQIALQSLKMETIGTLAGGIAHDFNNYLGAVTGSVYLLKRELQHMPEAFERLNKLEQITDRAASLIAQLMTFSRNEKLINKLLPYSELIEETKELSQLLIPRNVALHWQIAKHIYINGNASQLQQILLNMLKNSSDAIKDIENPMISVSLSTIEVGEKLSKRSGLRLGERFAMLTVEDNGCGIEEGNKESIFDPFFTTKEIGKGTGMGLAMAYGAVQSHLGWIELTSNKGEGTEFRLYFPMVSHEASGHPPLIQENSVTILLVDDEPMMLDIGSEILAALGYQVVTCDNGEDAVNLFCKHPDHFAMAILDVMMPRQNGVETALALRKICADFPILFATGYDADAVPQSLLSRSKTSLISKPWKIETLESFMQALLADQ
ncbi:MAG: hypothetical protein CO186_07010 [Zetaproteobacteria bacterium CG_4_9_14_3_um_filter_49_83]|nr:MAG: hypothetical protein AUJ56_04870 [Zetaproteobacteria bacterium CG1_02_49_23]PIQ33935.1 MAG: hypothetical protein COW62_03845 [Zetaproteobacteria bacterium CG17_big_fil_post_rev_8_21_14_2_50_50_13]PIV30176.1 MAG: hypothetical protein COS35_08130 [Zetaproteobacteria bacterium CG02_land_8_20_14_3_00_50_9]PIY54866.1 MAG: hypothetical protein COZ00_12550 [Zetaproteobacteria bacterium CG_4_10_14_0_8_um_filter_49_80]PJA35208.1 MAG: hypothetical protein CO186_07010 [Zetaproteobacteria bacterium